jgi:hypothetical protein
MRKDRLLDVNGLNAEYDISLDKRMKKYRWSQYKDTSRPSIPEAEKCRIRAVRWRNDVRKRQIIISVAVLLLVVGSIYLSWRLTYGA